MASEWNHKVGTVGIYMFVSNYMYHSHHLGSLINNTIYLQNTRNLTQYPPLTCKMPDTKTYQLPPTGEVETVHKLLAIAYMHGAV